MTARYEIALEIPDLTCITRCYNFERLPQDDLSMLPVCTHPQFKMRQHRQANTILYNCLLRILSELYQRAQVEKPE